MVSASEVDLSWGASTDNVGVTGYKVERCSGTGCTQLRPDRHYQPAPGPPTRTPASVASTTYSYRVRATDAAGNLSTYSNTANATTPAGPSGLVAAYGFDEGSGTTVADASGNGNNGTISNATWAAAGKFGKALQFNGTSSLVTVPNAASLQLSSGMTLEAWVNPSTVNANWRDVIYKGNDNYYLEATSTNASKPDAGMIAGGSYADAFGTAALTANTWSFLTETYDGSTLKLYVNGTQVASTAAHRRDRDFHEPAADRRRHHLRPVLRRPDRRRPRLQRRAHRRPDPDRHDDADRQQFGHDPADAAGDAERERGQCQRG